MQTSILPHADSLLQCGTGVSPVYGGASGSTASHVDCILHCTSLALVLGISAALTLCTGICFAQPADGAAAPADDLMQPTRYGLRADPDLIDGLARVFIREANPTRDLGLTDEQSEKMGDLLASQFLRSAQTHGPQWRDLIETTVEVELGNNGRHDGVTGPRFARQYLALIDEMRRLTRETTDESREFLNPEQIRMAQASHGYLEDFFDAMQKRMERWLAGDIQGQQYPFSIKDEIKRSPEELKQREQQRRRVLAEQYVSRELFGFLPEQSKAFMRRTAEYFQFTPEQRDKSDQIWSRYAAQVERIVTDQWKERFRRNRLRQWYSGSASQGVPRPWFHKLRREYQDLTAPLLELRMAFRDEIMALATAEQRRSVLARIEAAAGAHGIQPDEMRSMEMLLTQARPTVNAGPASSEANE